MVGKITAVLAKKAAETYSSQGLHREAISLYAGLLAESPNIDPAIKASIQSQIHGLCEEMEASDSSKGHRLSGEEIIRIKKGWGTKATCTDILVCAHAFYQIGSYTDALEEFKNLLRSDGLKKKYIHGAADCLAQLHDPDTLMENVIQFVKEIASTLKARVAVQLAMAKHLAAGTRIDHATAMFHHLNRYSALAPVVSEYLSTISAAKRSMQAPTPEAANTATMERTRPPESRFCLNRIGRLFRKKDSGLSH